MVKPIRFTKSTRKHKIGRAKVYEVLAHGTVEPTIVKTTGHPGLAFTGLVTGKSEQFELTVILIEVPNCFLVIHVQPNYRRST